jgi:Contractile injection system tape measure protein
MAPHRGNRIELEIAVARRALGEALLPRLSRLHSGGIAPLLDRVCSELSGPGRLDRIDTLELDLGTIPADDLDHTLLARLEAALRAELGRRLQEGRRSAGPGQASRELLECFARTGNLPWWADRRRSALIARHLEGLVQEAPEAGIRLLQGLADDPAAMARLARHCDDTLLAALVEAGGRNGGADLHRWESLLAGAGTSPAAAHRVRQVVLAELAQHGRLTSATTLAAVRQALGLAAIPAQDAVSDPGREARAAALREGAGLAPGTAASALPPDGAPRDGAAAQADRVRPAYRDTETATTPGPTGSTGPVGAAGSPGSPLGTSAGGPTVPEGKPIPEDPSLRDAERTLQTPDQPPAPVDPRTFRTTSDPRLAATRRRALERLDELYVEDAGLVILWPFLERFFVNTGLLGPERRFLDGPAQTRAIALLAQIAFEDPEPPEYLLPLAKLLGGLAPEEPFLPDEAPAVEQQECERLLVAVIGHAHVLRDMSPAAFRVAFLQRTGALTVRTGSWLLRVEAQPQDALLTCFSWSWAWLRLPWMPDPLQVEW